MKLRNIIKKLRPTSVKTKVLAGLVATGIVLTSALTFAGFSPANRPTFDWNNPDQRKGSLNGPVFNSFVNTPYYGDERAFFDSARTDQADGVNAFKDVTSYPTQGTKEVILRSYIHNNANQDTNASGLGIAKNTRIRIDLPTGTATELRARSYINWDNPAPGYAGEVTDTTELIDGTPFSVEYVPGSAILYTAAHPASAGGYKLSDGIVGNGVQVGYDNINGDFPGCFDYQASVEIRVRIKTPELKLEKMVRKAGVNAAYGKSTEVKPGDKIQWGLRVNNLGTAKLDDVAVSDQLPPHMQLVSGSVRYIDSAPQDVVQQDGPLFTTGGIGVGVLQPNSGFNIRFDTIAKDDFAECEVTVRNLAFVASRQYPEIQDYADVKIKKDNCNPTPKNPGVSIDKKVDGVEKKTVGVNQEFTYQLVVKNTGDVALTNVKVSDNAPANVQFISTDKGSIEGNKLTYTIPALAVGASVNINIRAKVTAEVAGDIVNTACVNAPEVNPNNPNDEDDCDDATVNVPTPIYSCDLLTTNKIGENKYRFTTTYTARNGATFKNVAYNYGDGTGVTTGSPTAEHTYTKDGTYNVTATVTFTVNGVDKTATSAACATQIEIAPKPVTPVYSCDLLTAEKIGEKQYRYTIKVTANNGANYKFATFDYGDGSDKFMTNKQTAEHTYTKDGTFVTRAVVTFDVNGENKTVESDKCAAPVTIKTTTTPPTVTPPTVLPNTGAGNIFGIFAATSMVGAILHKLYAARKEV